jgi:hypothetical protein
MSEFNLSNIKHYLVGNLRYKLHDNKRFNWLIRRHVREQIDFRIKVMNPICYNQGSCEICGCKTTALQMANKACDKPCYPTMMGRMEWDMFKRGGLYFDKDTDIVWQNSKGKVINFKTGDYVGNIEYQLRKSQRKY